MKHIALSLISFFFLPLLHAQDIIYKTDSTQIQCKVTKIGSEDIEYLKWDNLNGPVYLISKKEILLIAYENGTSEIFTVEKPVIVESTAEEPTNSDESKIFPDEDNRVFESTYGFYGSAGSGSTLGFYTDANWSISKNIPLFLTLGYGFLSDFDLLIYQYIPLNLDYRIPFGTSDSYLVLGGGLAPTFTQLWTTDPYYGYWETYFGFGFDLTAYLDVNGFRIGTMLPITSDGAVAIFNLGFAF